MKTTRKGFTLIELLIVISIIGILAVAFLPSLLGAPAKGRDAQRLATVQKITNFLVTESLAGNEMPATGCIVPGDNASAIGTLIASNLSDFGGVFPVDPQVDHANTIKDQAACTGMYGYYKYAAGDYKAAVYVTLENEDSANAICETFVFGDPVLGKVSPGANQTPCYVSLVQ